MQVDFSNNYFELFELPVAFSIDEQQLTTRYRSLQRMLHPDRHRAGSDTEQRWSMQAASFVNDGYQTLSNQLARAIYLLGLNGVSIDQETDTHMAPDFLMQQMELREALADAPQARDPYQALDSIAVELREDVNMSATAFEQAADDENWQQARTVVRQWQFLDKLRREVQDQEAALDA